MAFNCGACGASICGIVPEFFPTQYKWAHADLMHMQTKINDSFLQEYGIFYHHDD